MKLRNKKTGKIIKTHPNRFVINSGEQIMQYTSLAKLNEEWEDYEEPNEYYCIDWTEPDGIYKTKCEDIRDDFNKEIGNYFATREEAEKAVEKLKAWKRLKDKGFVFKGVNEDDGSIKTGLSKGVKICESVEFYEDMTLLFGGEE